MKKKLFLTALCAIGLCLIFSCSMDGATTTAPAAENPRQVVDTEILDTGIDESDDFSEEFYLNQARSFSILDEAMSPFRIAYDPETGEGSNVYNDVFSGVWIDGDGNLNIGVVQSAITEEVELSMGILNGQVIYRYDAFSYNFLARLLDAITEVMEDFGIYMVELMEDVNRLYIHLYDINRAGVIKEYLYAQGAFDENAVVFFDDPDEILFYNSTAYPGESINGGTIGVNAIDNATGRMGVITNEHVAGLGDYAWYYGNSIVGDFIGPVLRAKNGGTIDASFIPFDSPNNWDMTPNARDQKYTMTYTNIRLGKESQIVFGESIRKIGVTSGITTGNMRSTNVSATPKPSGGGTGIKKTNTFRFKTTTKKGDSGGPVYIDDGSTLWLIGITFSGDTSEKKGNACRISNIMKPVAQGGLDITPITNDTYQFSTVGSNISVNGLNISGSDYPVGRLAMSSQFNGKIVTQIGQSAFSGRTGLTSAALPSTVKSIGNNAFFNSGIWWDTANNTVVYADKWAVGYKGITAGTVSLNPNTVGIGDFAFYQKNVIGDVKIPANVKNIGANAFMDNPSFQRVWIPTSVTSIDASAFASCPSLTIYAQAASQPAGWDANWNYSNRPVFWDSPVAYGKTISTGALPEVAFPTAGGTPVTIFFRAQYSGSVTWKDCTA